MGILLSEIRNKRLRQSIVKSFGVKCEKSNPSALLQEQLRKNGFSDFVTEYHFAAEWVGRHPGVRERLKEKGWKDWRFDFYYGKHGFAIEVEGGTFGRPVKCHRCYGYVKRKIGGNRWVVIREGGRHNTGKGHEDDCKKYNVAESLGIRVFRFTTGMIKRGEAIEFIRDIFENNN